MTDLTIEIGNLTTRTEAIVGPAGSQVLIGQIVLEDRRALSARIGPFRDYVGRVDVFVSEPQRDDGGVDPGVQQSHGRRPCMPGPISRTRRGPG